MKVEINKKFKEALSLMEDSLRNIFIMGKDGTTKSAFMKNLKIRELT